MELSIDDVRTMIGSYVLELTLKEKEIKELKSKLEQYESNSVSKIHAVESPDVIIPKERA